MDSATDEAAEERDLFNVFSQGQDAVLKLLAAHRPAGETMLAICSHAEALVADSEAIAIRILNEGTLDFMSITDVDDGLRSAISDLIRTEANPAQSSDLPTHFDIADPANAQRKVWGIIVPGLGGQPLGALCVAHNSPTELPERAVAALYSAGHLLQLVIEQQRAAQDAVTTRAVERELIANQLHDDPIQAVTVLSLMLQRLERDAPDKMQAPLDRARRKADEAIERMRRLLFELHPFELESDGLAIATEVYLEETMEPLGVTWSVDDRLDAEPDVTTGVLAFRLVHEALANVATHADASLVSVTWETVDDGVSAQIVDDGVGFDPATIPPHRPGHLGISNVRYLAQRVGGRFDIDSTPGGGCAVHIWVPLNRQLRDSSEY